MSRVQSRYSVVGVALATAAIGLAARPQTPPLDRLRELPGQASYQKMEEALQQPAFLSGALNVLWADDSQSFSFTFEGRRRRFTVSNHLVRDVPEMPVQPVSSGRAAPASESVSDLRSPCPLEIVDRGRQAACEASPDRRHKAYYADRNLFVSAADGAMPVQVTRDGSVAARIKSGTASWVYGEELDQATAIWWAPDSRRVAFYRFDESHVPDYYLTVGQTSVQSALDVEAYPKAGTPNPIADVLVYDLETGRAMPLDVRDGKPFADDVVGHYVYGMSWAPDGSELRMLRTDRRQQVLEYIGCRPDTTRCRVIVHEEWPTGWVDNRPLLRPLGDGRRFLWSSDRNGWRNYYLYDVSGRLLNAVTTHTTFEAGAIVRVDEQGGWLYYMANDGDTPMTQQLHRVGLDGLHDVRLTDPRFTHAVSLAPDGHCFLDVYQAHDQAPASRVVDSNGVTVAELAQSNLSRFDALGLKTIEMFTYKAADGQTTLYGSIAFPSSFIATRPYPVLVSVYGGPESPSGLPSETFAVPPPLAEYDFLIVTLSTRAAPGRGRRILDALYGHLGQAEVDDLAAGVKALGARPYVDRSRVGIYGTSYGGYAALMALLRYPDLFSAASVSSALTDWRNYDTIYTERYMSTPGENKDGYDKGSALSYVANLRGRLLVYYGTADNNVHPSNSLQLIEALSDVGKSIEVQVGPDEGHSAVPMGRMMEFFVENLIVRPDRPLANPRP